jgi:hypothetical protein
MFKGYKTNPKDIIEKHIERIPEAGCWIWTGRCRPTGYGQVFVNKKTISAHKFSYETYKEPVKSGILVLHSCDNPSCVNPEHLFLGTQSDNMFDMYKKKRRSQKGELNGHFGKRKVKELNSESK